MFKTKAINHIALILAAILILTVLLQVSRSEVLLKSFSDASSDLRPSELEPVDALQDNAWSAIPLDRLWIIYDPADTFSTRIKNNTAQVLKEMKKEVRLIDVAQGIPNDARPDGVILALPNLEKLNDMDWLISYVHNGGSAMLAALPDNNDAFFRLYRKLGILEVGQYMSASNIHFNTNLLIGYEGYDFKGTSLENTVLRFKLDERAIVHASTLADIPLIWEMPYGQGTFIMCNGTMLQEKTSRGLIAGSVAKMLPDFIYPIYNAKLMYIDDFPAPIPIVPNLNIFREYKMNNQQFYNRIWWPDMIRLAKQHNLIYTAVLIHNYSDNVTPPFNWRIDGGDMETFGRYGREVMKLGGEIGIHGYNHQSLTLDKRVSKGFGYNAWASIDDMAASIHSALQFSQSVLPNYRIKTYVPPSNALDANGIEALKQSMPDLTNISSLYLEDANDLSYVQEFGINEDGYVSLPRVSSGFAPDTFELWTIANVATTAGIFSHFIHPDDITDDRRNKGLVWFQMRDQYQIFLNDIENRFDWLRSMTASEASNEVERVTLSKPTFDKTPDALKGYINHYTGPQYFILRSDKQIGRTQHCEVSAIDDDVYLIKALNPTFTVEWNE
ncbi:hypothetical protein PAECIP111893_04347 [Paenibacillus plantiphilus]|uniref:DUF2194 domain-containing protein n=1 Tax=Paenibacillus plantiphilus TaxID=2905650 RepID=A0ABM9CLW5_9BACL|nr:DUF2194 domain-containing protein [Paenibacillus plantiphilus]CAH1218015.1 hypothetical protein PAECIP111893_04347 [Paenibacillus plantiphilus]